MPTRTLSFVLAFSLGIAGVASSQTLPYCWDRSMEWRVLPASAVGTTQGNPGPDSFGNLVWQNEYVTTGGGLGSANPWYLEPATKCVWDDSWFGQAGGWVVSDDFGVNINQFGGIDSYGTSGVWFQYKPIVRWINTTGQPFSLSISGTLRIGWRSSSGSAGPMPTDVVIAHKQSAGAANVLFGSTVDKPSSSTAEEFIDLPVSIPDFSIAAGDEIIVSIRASSMSSAPGRFISFADSLRMLRDGGVSASATVRLGTPPNPDALRPTMSTRPAIGRTWGPFISHGTFMPGATIDALLITVAPANLSTFYGTLLCDLSGPVIVLPGLPGAPFPVRFPNHCLFAGASLCCQGISATASAAGLTNALDVVVGTH